MNPIVVSYWHNSEASAHSNYAHSYILSQNNQEVYRVDLNLARGFFELSEFVEPKGKNNFMIEQTSQSNNIKVNIFDKTSGSQIAVLCNDIFKNDQEQPIMELKRLSDLSKSVLRTINSDNTADDYAAIGQDGKVVATLVRLPKPSQLQAGLFTRISRWAKAKADTPTDVLEVQIINSKTCSIRALCALSVIVLARKGLPLPSTWQDTMQQQSGT